MRHLWSALLLLAAAALLAKGWWTAGYPAPDYRLDGVSWRVPDARAGEVRNGRLVYLQGTRLELDGAVLLQAGDPLPQVAARLRAVDGLWEDGGGLEPSREWVGGRVALRRYLDGPEPEDAHASGRALYVYVDASDRVVGLTLDFEMPHCGLREGLRLALGG